MEPLVDPSLTAYFEGLEDGVNYSLTVWTVLNGKKIIGVTQQIERTVETKGLYPRLI